MWEINNGFQALSFIYSIISGIMLAVFYDIFKAFRISFKLSYIFIFFTDISYYIVTAIASFFFFLSVSDGEIRFYILFGFTVGFLIWRITLSRFFLFIFKYILVTISRVLNYLSNKIYNFFDMIFCQTIRFSKKAVNFLINNGNTLKKLLKIQKGLLYTKQE